MQVRGISPRYWRVWLYLSLAVTITASLKILGSLPVFALMVIPPLIALKKSRGLRDAFQIAMLTGTVIPALGYYFSFLFSFPTGASIILTATLFFLASLAEPLFVTVHASEIDDERLHRES